MAAESIGGRYRLDSLLGQGGMSEVWCADDLELGRRVALKLLAPDADRQRFDREARAAAALAHPNITQLYDYGEADGRPFMVLEYLPGGTLEDRLEPGTPFPDAETARVAHDVAAGLAHAHARGLVHRDLKPANVLFDAEDRAKIADFGIARLGQGGTLTEAGTVLGTAAYISPEQAAGEQATPASDVYSFGVLLYRLLTGRLPFVSDDALALVSLHRDAAPPPLEELRPEAPAALAAVATAALAKDPAARPADGAAVAVALRAAASEPTADAVATDTAATRVIAPAAADAPPPAANPNRPRRRRRRAPFVVAGILALLAAGGTALAFTVARSTGGPTETPTTFPASTAATTTRETSSTVAPVVATTAVPPAESVTTTTTATTRTATTATTQTETATTRAQTIPTGTTPPIDTVTVAPTDTTTTTIPPPGTTTGP